MRYSELARKLRKLGVRLVERRKRHDMWGWEKEGRVFTTTIPRHPGQEVPPGLLERMLKDLGVGREEF